MTKLHLLDGRNAQWINGDSQRASRLEATGTNVAAYGIILSEPEEKHSGRNRNIVAKVNRAKWPANYFGYANIFKNAIVIYRRHS